jgi:hypothetical protein
MAIAVVLEWAAGDAGVSEDTYWQMTDKLGLRERLPEGCSYHVAARASASVSSTVIMRPASALIVEIT